MQMKEGLKWPEPKRFSEDFEMRRACAELMAELLSVHGSQYWATWDKSHISITKTEHVTAHDVSEDGFIDALRISECLSSPVTTSVNAGDVHYFTESDTALYDQPARAFSLELGRVGLDDVDDPEDIDESEYRWKALALAVIELDEDEPLTSDNVTLLNAETGEVLSTEREWNLYSILNMMSDELRARNFSDTTTIGRISQSELYDGELPTLAKSFQASDFIVGISCDKCYSEHSTCSHNGSAN